MIAEAVASAIKDKSDKAVNDANVDQQFADYVVSLVSSAQKKKVMPPQLLHRRLQLRPILRLLSLLT